jgi:hypothetical protein
MPTWLWLLLGAGALYLVTKKNTTDTATYGSAVQAPGAVPSNAPIFFNVGDQVFIDASVLFSDAALTQNAGNWPGGMGTIKAVDTVHASVGFVGPTGQGLGGGAYAYVPMSVVSPSGSA